MLCIIRKLRIFSFFRWVILQKWSKMDIDVSKNKFFKLLMFHCLLVRLETTLDETFILTDTFRIIKGKKL